MIRVILERKKEHKKNRDFYYKSGSEFLGACPCMKKVLCWRWLSYEERKFEMDTSSDA